MKILTAAGCAKSTASLIERGIPGLILMENAGSRVVDFLCETFAPLKEHVSLWFAAKAITAVTDS